MLNRQRARQLLAHTMQAQLTKTQQPRLRVIATESLRKTPAFESFITQPLFANSQVESEDRLTLEGMQQMENAKKLKEEQKNEPPIPGSTVANVYVTSPVSILKGEAEALRTIGQAVTKSLNTDEKVAVALLPVKVEPLSEAEQFYIDAAIDSIERTVALTNIEVCTSLEGLQKFLQGTADI